MTDWYASEITKENDSDLQGANGTLQYKCQTISFAMNRPKVECSSNNIISNCTIERINEKTLHELPNQVRHEKVESLMNHLRKQTGNST